MKAIDTRRYEMLVRVRDFGAAYGHLFSESTLARQKFADVAAAVTNLDAHALAHVTASVSARGHVLAMAREALREELQAIGQTARVLAEHMPALERQFEQPASAADQVLLTTGRKFARDVEPLESHFVAHGMPATFALLGTMRKPGPRS